MTPKKKTQPEEVQDAILEPATPTELIKALIRALGHEPAEVAGVTISAKYARIQGTDRSLRIHAIGTDWNALEKEEDSGD